MLPKPMRLAARNGSDHQMRLSDSMRHTMRQPSAKDGCASSMPIVSASAPAASRSWAPRTGSFIRQARTTKIAELGRAHVCTPGTNAQLVCRLLLEKKQNIVHL